MPVPEQHGRTKWAPGSLLAGLSARERESILTLGRVRQYHSGEVFFNQGDLSDFVVIIIDGYVKITAVSESGTESLIAIRTAGDIVGELAAFDGRPRSATARAADAVHGRVITKPDLDRLLRDDFAVASALNQAVSVKLRESTRRRVDFRRGTRGRLAQVLVDLYHGSTSGRRDETMAVLVTQSELAGLIGASEPAVHKALRALRDAGIIGTGYGRLTIEDITKLQRIAQEVAGGP
jgi:CRP/FNR family transcriptional regulator, cyclic AMP receptor protein